MPRFRSSPASHAGLTIVACNAWSTVTACSGCQDGRSSSVRRTPAAMPASGSSSSTGASDPFATSAPESQSERYAYARSAHTGPDPVGEVAVGRGVAELDRRCDAERREPWDVLPREQLRVLDPWPQAAGCPEVTGLLERVQRVPIRQVADRVHCDGEAGAGGAPNDVRELVLARDLDAGAVEKSRRLRPESAVHERLDVADAEVVVPEPRGEADLRDLVQLRRWERLPDADRQPFLARSAWKRGSAPSQPSLSWMAVTPREAASRSAGRISSSHSSSAIAARTRSRRNSQADSSRRTPVGSPDSSRSTTPPGTLRSPSPRASAAELSQSEWPSRAMSATGESGATASRSCLVGSTGGDQSPLRQPLPRIHDPRPTRAAPSATRATASSSVAVSLSWISFCASDQRRKCTCESVKPGRTQRPPRSTRSGLASAVSCAPTPPAIRSPAIASAAASGRVGSIVRMTPFSKITTWILCSIQRAAENPVRLDSRRRGSENGPETCYACHAGGG